MTVKGVLLDLDNTLYPFSSCHQAGLQASFLFLEKYLRCNRKQFDAAYRAARRGVHKRLHGSASSHNRLLYFQLMLEKSGKDALGLGHVASEKYWQAYLRYCVLEPGAKKLLRFLKTKRVCLLTDMTVESQFQKIKLLGLEKFVQNMVSSEEVGIEKPNPLMFKMGLRKMKVSRRDAVMIGDDFERDIAGAAKLGIKSFWFVKYVKNPDLRIPAPLRKHVVVCRDYNDVIDYLSDKK